MELRDEAPHDLDLHGCLRRVAGRSVIASAAAAGRAEYAVIADMTGLIEFGGIWQKRGRVYGVPAYWAFRMYSTPEAIVPTPVTLAAKGAQVEHVFPRLSVTVIELARER